MEKIILQVEGMSCNHCKMSVEKAVKELGGEAVVNLAEKTVTVSFDSAKTNLEDIITELEDLGYDVVK